MQPGGGAREQGEYAPLGGRSMGGRPSACAQVHGLTGGARGQAKRKCVRANGRSMSARGWTGRAMGAGCVGEAEAVGPLGMRPLHAAIEWGRGGKD